MKKVEIFTDGACSGNPGPGGWGAILRYGEHELELSGGEPQTTNNRMELTGVIEALRRLKEPCEVVLTSDSRYVCDAVTKGWAESWRRKGWHKADGKPALNADLWETLLGLLAEHRVRFQWIKGHAGHPQNERCDHLAVTESQKYRNATGKRKGAE
jgi:ribonuclease HI